MATRLRLTRSDSPSFELEDGQAVVGREPGCTLVIDDRSVSRRHAVLELRDGAWWVADQGSANGTFLDGQRVAESKLRDGQELRLGSVSFHVEVEAELAGTMLMQAPDMGQATVLMAAPEFAPPVPVAAAAPPPVIVPPPVVARPPAVPPPVAKSRSGAPAVAPPPVPAAPSRGSSIEEAAALLGAGAGASPYDIKRRYDELVGDLQTKLAGAQTPVLRATYQKNLDALHQAFKLTSPEVSTEDSLADLPAVQPSVGPDLLDGSVARRFEPIVVEASSHHAGLPTATTFLAVVATLMAASSAYFALSARKFATAATKLESSADLANERQLANQFKPAQVLLDAGILRNRKLSFCNRGTTPIEIAWFGAVYLTKGEKDSATDPAKWDEGLAAKATGFTYSRYNSGFCKDFRLRLGPGEQRDVVFKSDADPRCAFDGQGLFWAASVARGGGPPESASPPAATAGMGKNKRAATEPAADYAAGLIDGECVNLGGS